MQIMAKRLCRVYPHELDLPNTFMPEGREEVVQVAGEGLVAVGKNSQGISVDDVILLYLSEYAGKPCV